MESSILNTMKGMLGISIDDDAFDMDILVHINSVLLTLSQLGVTTDPSFIVTGPEEEWSDIATVAGKNFEEIKSYMYLNVRILFDPPSSSFVLDAMNRSIQQKEFRLNVLAEEGTYVPTPLPEEL